MRNGYLSLLLVGFFLSSILGKKQYSQQGFIMLITNFKIYKKLVVAILKMATNSLTCFPHEVESEPHALQSGLALATCLLVTEQKGSWGFSSFCGNTCSLHCPLWIPGHHAVRNLHHMDRTCEGALDNSLRWAQPSSHSSSGDKWVKKPQGDPRPQPSESSPAAWVFQAQAPDTVKQGQVIPAVPWPNSWPAGSVSPIRWLLFHVTKLRGWLQRQQINWKVSAIPKPISNYRISFSLYQ